VNASKLSLPRTSKIEIMARAKLKFSPAIADRTVKQDGDNDEEGMEAVLFHNKERRQRRQHRSNRENAKHDSLQESDDDMSAIFEAPQNTELLDLVEENNWETLLYRVLKQPHIAHVKFTGRSTNSSSAGNLILHETCKQNPPIDVVEALVEANDKAVTTKGNAGFLPFHYACAHGASIETIRFLYSLHPDAARAVDDDEGILPLHLACMTGTTKEDVYMCLLTSYPEGSMVRDDFGRLPVDYAKSIRSDSHRKIAIECLKRAKWLEMSASQSRDRTESEYHRRIKGYEQSQVQHLKMIEDVHKKQITKLEENLESQRNEATERSQDLEELDKHLQEMTDEFRERVESMEKSTKTKNRKLQGQIDKAKEETKKIQAALDIKVEETVDLTQKLEESKDLDNSLSRQLKQRTEELDFALDDIETLNQHSEWLESVVESIRNLTNSESPVGRDGPRKESSTIKKPESSKKLGSTRKSRDSASVSSRKSEKKSRSVSRSVSRGASSRHLVGNKTLHKSVEETREPSFVSRMLGSRRE